MGRPTQRARAARAERRAMIALVALFAFLLQALVPAAATAAPGPLPGMLICTDPGVAVAPDAPPAAPESHACQHCVCPTASAPPPPLAALQTIAYDIAEPRVAETPRRLPPQARAPPRPPGQGPPASNA